jgi:hypothetical protein
MRSLANRLQESGLAPDLRTDKVESFAADLDGALGELDEGVLRYPVEPLRTFQTAEELVLRILPSDPER